MVPIVSIVGKSDSGKTTLLVKLIPILKRKGYRVATIKHDVHGFEMDREGKDTYRHFHCGADAVLISSPRKIALIKRIEQEAPLDALAEQFYPDMDIVSFGPDIRGAHSPDEKASISSTRRIWKLFGILLSEL